MRLLAVLLITCACSPASAQFAYEYKYGPNQYNYDVSGYGGSGGGSVSGNLDTNGKYVEGTVTLEDGTEIEVEGVWVDIILKELLREIEDAESRRKVTEFHSFVDGLTDARNSAFHGLWVIQTASISGPQSVKAQRNSKKSTLDAADIANLESRVSRATVLALHAHCALLGTKIPSRQMWHISISSAQPARQRGA